MFKMILSALAALSFATVAYAADPAAEAPAAGKMDAPPAADAPAGDKKMDHKMGKEHKHMDKKDKKKKKADDAK